MGRDFEDHCWKDIVDEEILEIYEPYRREVRVGVIPRRWRSISTTRLIRAVIARCARSIGATRAPAARTRGRRSSRRGRCSPPRARPACR
jgi:hypothetical protein